MELFFAPSALRVPISLVRSVIETSIIFITPIPPTKREMPAINAIAMETVSIMSFMELVILLIVFFTFSTFNLKKKYEQPVFILSDCRQSGARTVVLAPFFSVCSNRSPKMIKKSILSSLSYRFFEASLLVFLDSCRQR